MLSCIPRCPIEKTPLNIGITIFAPISSVPGSATLQFLQPLLTAEVPYSAGIQAAYELFIFIAQNVFCLEALPIIDVTRNVVIQMPLSELQQFLQIISRKATTESSGIANSNTPGERGFLTVERPEAPLIIGLSIYSDYSNLPACPSIQYVLPIISLPGLRGSIPMLILIILATIFTRAVVPPETTGAKPLRSKTPTDNKPLTFSSDELLQFLSKFGKHFAK
ncbi:MAG: hypothetical protein M0T74_08305 [Desulfitobacterium hafniense]|nr:hypothetical protein [Desulfitobacterium hafniense]